MSTIRLPQGGTTNAMNIRLPKYSAGAVADLEIQKTGFPSHLRGYYSTMSPAPRRTNWTLTQRGADGRKRVWMSLAPMEIESQWLHVAAANGDVVVLGLGMGLAAFAIAQKPTVNRVTVIEKNPNMVELLHRASDFFKNRNVQKKLGVIMADAFEWETSMQFNSGYADIWMSLGAKEAVEDMKRISKRIKASRWGWWGQEIDFAAWCGERGKQSPPSDTDCFEWEEDLGLLITGVNTPRAFSRLTHAAAMNFLGTANGF